MVNFFKPPFKIEWLKAKSDLNNAIKEVERLRALIEDLDYERKDCQHSFDNGVCVNCLLPEVSVQYHKNLVEAKRMYHAKNK